MTDGDEFDAPERVADLEAAAAGPFGDAGDRTVDEDDYLSEEVEEEGHPVRTAIEWGAIIVGAFLAALIIKTWLFQAFFIPSGSMLPTLEVGDRVLVNKLSYELHDINRGDLVVFERPPDSGSDPEIHDLIKRVIGLPGEQIETNEGRVVIDGRILEEPYLPDRTRTLNLQPQTIPDGFVFVMGDNRGDSRDSRTFGPISEGLVIGRAFVRVWPVTDFTFL